VTITQTSDQIVEQYVGDLYHALRFSGNRTRNRFLNEIKEHIAEGRTTIDPNDDDALRNLLQRIGDPDTLAVELMESQRIAERNPLKRTIERHGLRRLIATVLVVLVVASITVGLFVAAHYQPIYLTDEGELSEVFAANGTEARVIPDNAPTFLNVPRVYAEPSGKFIVKILFYVYNGGSYPISITNVQNFPLGYPPPHLVVRFDNRGNTIGGPRFHRFSLGAHQQQLLMETFSQACQADKGESVGETYVPVTYSFFGFQRTVNVSIQPFYIEMRSHC
jgi:hypothetical protein